MSMDVALIGDTHEGYLAVDVVFITDVFKNELPVVDCVEIVPACGSQAVGVLHLQLPPDERPKPLGVNNFVAGHDRVQRLLPTIHVLLHGVLLLCWCHFVKSEV